MKKQKIQMIILLVVLVLLIGGYFFLQSYNKKQEEKEDADKIQVAQIDADAIEAFSYQLNGETLSFTKIDGNWSYDQNTELHMDNDRITSMLANVTKVEADEEIDGVTDLSEYGLEDPANVITVTTADQTYTFTVGDHNATANCYYFMTDQQPDVVYTMTSGLCGSFQETADDLIKLESVVSDNSAETDDAAEAVTDEASDAE
ncbi:DUF4340 domain-containing protein [Kineothrix sp. MSJ-39]|uniref:DUF4340 domain-containing protein n=1 Tax=Kineothrix sp. MSJ-39 TaxID=2841533 RepID=UPI001C11F06D|nr:DUF4340 domain-containing protein [Kineothrix sp. MSJ-39]MBU5429894.1 DUF4340 domain-containing protein [Kineothrix sp. MSJ-39]